MLLFSSRSLVRNHAQCMCSFLTVPTFPKPLLSLLAIGIKQLVKSCPQLTHLDVR